MLSTVIFDLDGVIVDTEPIYYYVSNILFKRFEIKINSEERNRLVGISPWKMWDMIKITYSLSESVEYLVRLEKEAQYNALKNESELKCIVGIDILLSSIKNKNKKLAIASSSSHKIIEFILDRVNLKEYFNVIVSGDDVHNGKPSPDIFLLVSSLLSVMPNDCIVVEDSKNGIISAKSAGMFCVAYNNPSSRNQDLSNADIIFDDFSKDSRKRFLELLDDID